MRKLLHIGLMLGAVIGLSVVGAGCGGGFDNEEAVEVCQGIQERQQGCVPDLAFAQCVSCFEECGRACAQLESCPLQFTCD